ncbi:MAG: tetratricopeptide repeat protein [Planctomycetota bacterium]
MQRLRELARAELDRPAPPVPVDVPAPPGVDPQALAVTDRPEARLDLESALAEVAAGQDLDLPRKAIELPAAEEAAAAEALSLYLKGRQAVLDNKPLVGVTELRKALDLDPGSVAIKRELARAYLGLNGMPSAVGLYVQILQQEPQDPEALLTLAMVSAERRDFGQAAAILARAWELPVRSGQRFAHDGGADFVAADILAEAMHHLGYVRASMEAARTAAQVQLGSGVIYARRLGSVYRQRSDLWRMIGDGHCRLGEHADALSAYEQAALLPTPDPGGLTARVVYANLRMGRSFNAQFALLQSLRSDPERIGDREIGLCRYVAEHAVPFDELGEAVLALYEERRDQANLARAAASLQPEPRSTELLKEFVARQPRDTTVVTQLLRWLSDEDMAAAAALAVELVRDHPDLAEENVRRLVVAGPSPTDLLRAARTLPATPERAIFEARLLAQVEALGRAWSVAQDALRTWPDDDRLLLLQLDIAGMLGERDLIESSLAAADEVEGAWGWIARSRVLGGIGDAEAAVEAARRAVADGSHRVDALLALARAEFLLASETVDEREQRRVAQSAAATADRVIEEDPTRDGAHEILVNLYRSNAILADAGELGRVAEQLRESYPESRLLALLVAQDMINQGRFDPAVDRLLALYAADPTDGVSLSLAVAMWTQMRRTDDAVSWLVDQRRERPGDPLLLEQWTRLEIERGNVARTLQAIRAEVQADPENDIAKRLLESCLLASDRVEEAVEIGRARLMARPQGVARELGLASMFARADMDEAAIGHLEWVLEESTVPDADDLLSALAIASELELEGSRRDDVVLGLAERIIEERPNAPLRVYGAALRVLAGRGSLQGRFDQLSRRASRGARWHGPRAAPTRRPAARCCGAVSRSRSSTRITRSRRRGSSGPGSTQWSPWRPTRGRS